MVQYVSQIGEAHAANRVIQGMTSDERFSYPGKIQPGDIYKVFRDLDEPVLSTTEIDSQIDWASRSTVRRQLIEMEEDTALRSKKAGDRDNAGVVWFVPEDMPEIPQPTPDLVKLIYQHPWMAMVVGGILSVGIGFLFFVPGYFGEGRYLGIVAREWLLLVSLILFVSGVAVSYAGSGLLIGKAAYRFIRNWM